MQKQTYILQKDLPGLKAGAVFAPHPEVPYWYKCTVKDCYGEQWNLNREVVEKSDWFSAPMIISIGKNPMLPGEILIKANDGKCVSLTDSELYDKLFN